MMQQLLSSTIQLVSVIMAHDTVLTEDTKDLINSLVMEKDAGIKESINI